MCVGIDVDDLHYHGSALDKRTGEVLDLQCRRTFNGLSQQLEKIHQCFDNADLKQCYEASQVGFSLQRNLNGRGYHCEVASPSRIPRRGGKSVKTDRLDATKLAEFYANGLLTVVTQPDVDVEQDLDLRRSRQQLIQLRGSLLPHIGSLSRSNGLHYKAETARIPTGKRITTVGTGRARSVRGVSRSILS